MTFIIIAYGNYVFRQNIGFIKVVKSSDYNEENEIRSYINIYGDNCNMYYLKVKEDIMSFDDLNNKINNEFINYRIKGSNNLYDKKITELKKEIRDLLCIEKPPTFKNMTKKETKLRNKKENDTVNDCDDEKEDTSVSKKTIKKKNTEIIEKNNKEEKKITKKKNNNDDKKVNNTKKKNNKKNEKLDIEKDNNKNIKNKTNKNILSDSDSDDDIIPVKKVSDSDSDSNSDSDSDSD